MMDVNPKVVADRQGTFYFKCLFLHLLIFSSIVRMFFKIKILNKKHTCKNASITHSESLKKIHLFLQRLVEGHFLFYMFFR
jgi:hypothetical protein